VAALLATSAWWTAGEALAQKMPVPPPVRGTRVGNVAVDLSLADLNGRPHSLQELRGKQVVHIVFWATWCVPCLQEVPTLRGVYDKYRQRGLEILAVVPNLNQTPDSLRAFARESRISYPVLWDEKLVAMNSYHVSAIPQNFLIGKDGIVRFSGTTLPDDYESLIERLLQEGGGVASGR
jgi:peroxiredoxin